MNLKVSFSELYLFEDPFSNRWLRLEPMPEFINEELANMLAFGRVSASNPVKFRGFMGGSTADILRTSLPPFLCVSEKVIYILKDNHFTGWSTYPVEVSDRNGNNLPGYYGLAVTSYAGERDLARSPIIQKEPITQSGKKYSVYKGFYFEENKWDGSDVFRVGNGYIIVTKAVRDLFTNTKIRNVEFIALPDDETNTSIY
jgi:hypothetical protein